MQPLADLDAINRRAWRDPATVRMYQHLEGWTDPGEQVAVESVAAEMRSLPILDIGVGAGRTTGLLRAISCDYVGIDYTPEMVEACRVRHPGARVEHMDARDLGAFSDGQFALVVFSYNGIDAVDFADRMRVLREVHRVLRPRGIFLMSAHNRDAPGVSTQRPRLHLQFSWNPLRLGWRLLQLARSWVRSAANYRRFASMTQAHGEWTVRNCAAHDFSIVILYTSLAGQKRQLQEAGFVLERVAGSSDGQWVTVDIDTRNPWLHYIARKAG
ncbi:MAG: class I SAM-dependent methyltransferase [Pseudomonadota bacterium]